MEKAKKAKQTEKKEKDKAKDVEKREKKGGNEKKGAKYEEDGDGDGEIMHG